MAKKILIAEDEIPLSNALKLKLTNAGYEVTTVADGEAAIESVAKEKYDLLLLDLMMPKLDGFGVLESLQKSGNGPKVIVTSNLSQEEDLQKAKSLGAVDFFIKSNTPLAEIVTRVKDTLGV